VDVAEVHLNSSNAVYHIQLLGINSESTTLNNCILVVLFVKVSLSAQHKWMLARHSSLHHAEACLILVLCFTLLALSSLPPSST
jgi:hypothetical protein